MRRFLIWAVAACLAGRGVHAQELEVITGPTYATVLVDAQELANRRRIEAAFTPTFPTGGLFNSYFDASVGTTIGIWSPVGTGRSTSSGGWLQPVIGGAFQYDHYLGNDEIQVNTLTQNLNIESANAYTGMILFGLQGTRRVGQNVTFAGAGLGARAGGIAINEEPIPFDPARRVGTPTFDYEDDGVLVGYRLEGWAGMQLRNDIAAFFKVGFGQDWTDAILGDTHSSSSVTLSFGIAVPLGPRSTESVWVEE